MYIGHHIKYPLYLSDFNQTEVSQQIFKKYSNIKFPENPSCGSQVGQAGMTKIVVTFCSFLNVSKNCCCHLQHDIGNSRLNAYSSLVVFVHFLRA